MSSILEETAGRVRLAPLTVDQYEAMIAQGILAEGEPIELLDGLLVPKDRARAGGAPLTVGPEHQLVVNRLARLMSAFERLGCYLSIQGPLRLPPRDEPEPDAAVIRGVPEDFAARHPGPDEVCSVIEVSDSSLQRDRTTKLRIYAAAGIRQYVIVNLVDRRVEVHEDPAPADGRFRAGPVELTGDAEVRLAAGAGEGVVVRVADLLP
ncbi:MAG: Uma2 family endonuclease [Planctomycetes bacterium]|nr:Uma2 family endonuclease [Planctomycetota bacterium]